MFDKRFPNIKEIFWKKKIFRKITQKFRAKMLQVFEKI